VNRDIRPNTPLDLSADDARLRRRVLSRFTPREGLSVLVGVLSLILLALVLYLALLLQPSRFGGQPPAHVRAGIRPLREITGPGVGKLPEFLRPMGAAFGKDGRMYVADTGNNRICAFDAKGKYLFQFGEYGTTKPADGSKSTWKPGQFDFPTDVATDERGNVIVADFHNDQIQMFTSEGRFVRAFPNPRRVTGTGGSGAGGTGIAVTAVAASNGLVYATDTYQVFVFAENGRLLRQFGEPGVGPSGLDHPNGIDVASDGTIYVSDSNHNRVLAFSPAGRPLWQLGRAASTETTSPAPGAGPSPFGLPRGVTTFGKDQLIVVDAFSFRLVRVRRDGTLLTQYGERGTEPAQMNFPNGIDASGDKLIVADKENNRAIEVQLVGR